MSSSRFYSQKDIDTFDKFNKELVGDLNTGQDGIIYQPVIIYKVSAYDTEVQTTTTDEFGPDVQQNVLFSFLRQSLVDISYVVEIGDVVDWNSGYWEISSISENQLVGGQTDYNHSVICNAFFTSSSDLE